MNENLVFDIGMHKGEDTRYYLSQGYRVLAIEANPVLADAGKEKFKKQIDAGRLTILNIGVANSEGILPFYKNLRLSEWSSFDKSIGTRNGTPYEVIDVQCTTTKKLFETYGVPYYMKVDIEGYDYLCLQDIPESGNKPQFVSCEACSLEWLGILKSKGYTKFKMISQGDNYVQIDLNKEKKSYYPKYQTIKNGIKLRLQKIIPFKHFYGSSGPFGNATEGEWKTYEQVKEQYESFYDKQTGQPLNPVSWFDFHASL